MMRTCSKNTIRDCAIVGVVSAMFFIPLTVLIDSFFWQEATWPELEVLFFNTYENRSSEWGTSPWHWYFTSALVKILTGQILLFVCGIISNSNKLVIDVRISHILFPILSFIALYSLLPHKELRFLFPVLPGINILAAIGLSKM
jgi:alpha-1,6-mannosyltransferase